MQPPTALAAAASGLALGASLIVAVGAQNTFVLRQGLRREHVGPVVALCIAMDGVLTSLGVAGLAASLGMHPRLLDALALLGAAFLLAYGAKAARRALSAQAIDPSGPVRARGAPRCCRPSHARC